MNTPSGFLLGDYESEVAGLPKHLGMHSIGRGLRLNNGLRNPIRAHGAAVIISSCLLIVAVLGKTIALGSNPQLCRPSYTVKHLQPDRHQLS